MSFRVLITALTCLLLPVDGWAQHAQVRTAQTSVEHLQVAVEANWPKTLVQIRDSLGISTAGSNMAIQFAGLDQTANATIDLQGSRSARITVLAAEYDELQINADTLPPELLLDQSTESAVSLENIGWYRKRLVGNVVIKMIGYDEARGVLRRYKKLSVSVVTSPDVAPLQQTSNPHIRVARSALASGTIFKLPIRQDGVYVVNRQVISELGLDPDATDPNTVKIFGNGGAPLPAKNSDPRPADLVEKNVQVQGGGDGSFGTSDAVYFFANDVSGWTFDNTDKVWEHYTHPFANEGCIFLVIDGSASSAINALPFPDLASPVQLSTVAGRYVRDFETFMWSKEHGSGHTWVSNPIRQGGEIDIADYADLQGLVNGELTFQARVAIASNPRASVDFVGGVQQLASVRAPFAILPGAERATASPTTATFLQTNPGQPGEKIVMRLPAAANEPQAALDWVRISYTRDLVARSGMLQFNSDTTDADKEFSLSGFAGQPLVWDVTNSGDETALETRSSGGSYQIQISGPSPREIVAFLPSAARQLETTDAVSVPNQNLHELPTFPDYVIIAPAEFMGPATELANIRRAEGLITEVIDIDQITNEFSGGVPDMRAVRDFLKFLYDRAPDEDSIPDLVLLFGDGNFDFRKIGQGSQDVTNWIYPYETENSFVPDQTFTSDDYFGLLDDDEGEWLYRGFNLGTNERLDIGIGRLPARSLAEAELMLEKIRTYENANTYGPWRTRYTFVADDAFTGSTGGSAEFDLHLQNMDSVAELVRGQLYPNINTKKIYGEAFERVFQNEFRIPGAKAEILKSIEEGILLFNYSGHGGPVGLAQEELFTKSDAEELTNGDKLAIFVTATCSFGWWDIDDTHSAAEALLTNPNGGAVAMLTTSRLVYTSGDTSALNPGLNRELNKALFARPDGKPRRLGDAFLQTKNTNVGLVGNSRKFSLLGDPAMRLGLPERDVVIERVNDQMVNEEQGQIRALDRITVHGYISDGGGQRDVSFDGIANITVFDAERRVPVKYRRWMPTPDYGVREDLIWRGDVGVAAGEFSATFVVPKDISYSDDFGRISAYAYNAQNHAIGYNENFIVGGTSDNPPDDTQGPDLELFLNDSTFVSGGLTTSDPTLIVELFDESGINTVGAGVGHELLLVIDGNESEAVDISEGFASVANSYQRGRVEWPLENLPEGEGSVIVRAWDVLNNSGIAELSYVVLDSENLSIQNVFNYPNPTPGRTRFVFEHNQLPGTEASVQVRVYSLNGKPVKTIETDDALPAGVLSGGITMIPWDGRDEDGDKLATGIYLYKLRIQVETPSGERQVAERIEKLAIIR